MFVTIWLFGLFENGTESLLLNRADGTWLFLIASVVGIRRFRLKDGITPRSARLPSGLDGRSGRRWQPGAVPARAVAMPRTVAGAARPAL